MGGDVGPFVVLFVVPSTTLVYYRSGNVAVSRR